VSGEDYAAGVQNPRTAWAAAAVAAAPVQAAAVQAAIARGAYAQGIRKAGDAKWQSKAAGKGAARFGPGVAEAESDYASAVAPYLNAINALTLPARGPKGDPRNLERVRVINQALHQLRTQQSK
jgi:hypothetical protein